MKREPLDPTLLERIPVFAGVDFDVPSSTIRLNALVRLDRGEVLFHQGDRCTGFYYVESGRVRLTVNNRLGTTTTVEIIGEGETFGEAMVFMERPYPVTSTALADSVLYLVSSPFVDAMLAGDPRTARRLLANLSMRNHQLVADVAALTLETATQRVCAYLLRQEQHSTPAGWIEVELADPKKVVANRLNLTPESMSRALRRLADDGTIEMDGATIRFDPKTLKRLIDL